MTARMCLSAVTQNKDGSANNKCDTSVEQMANIGGSVTIKCKYPRGKENDIKGFCREDANCRNLISTYESNYTKRDRFSLTDYKQLHVFTVVVSTLTLEDDGSYHCVTKGLDDSQEQCHARIQLSILNWENITPVETLHHFTGASAQINCPYEDSLEDSDKVVCKGENPFNCSELIHTTEQDREVVDGKFSIRDNRRRKNFYMYIKNLSTADSGTYWCVPDRTRQHYKYTKILLSVGERHNKSTKLQAPDLQATSPPIPADEPSDTDAAVIVGGVCLAFSAMALVALVLYRHKLPRRQGRSSEQRTNPGHNTEESDGDHQYEEIDTCSQQASSGNALTSIYATVNPHTEQLHYSTVSFQNNTVSVLKDGNKLPDTIKSGFTACDCSSVRTNEGPAAEPTLYSTITRDQIQVGVECVRTVEHAGEYCA
ncbi:hypothetical protein Q5P01_026335 [Channa striata]|uniref:Immunoglobulin domain-containing protein n=1 Tax=Channa striata TaxID=64152 RepID=A0AA88LNP6_CHASR|nr:hypothetical protein Q5P01_026335 [Channa striata]